MKCEDLQKIDLDILDDNSDKLTINAVSKFDINAIIKNL